MHRTAALGLLTIGAHTWPIAFGVRENENPQTDSIRGSPGSVLFVTTFSGATAGMALTHTGRRGTNHQELFTMSSGRAFRHAHDITDNRQLQVYSVVQVQVYCVAIKSYGSFVYTF